MQSVGYFEVSGMGYWDQATQSIIQRKGEYFVMDHILIAKHMLCMQKLLADLNKTEW